MKPILCLDFDGVLHSYTNGWKGADVIPDEPVAGAMAFLVKASESFEVHIFSSRSNQPGGIKAMQEWVAHHLVGHVPGHEPTMRAIGFTIETLKWPTEKPAAFVTIDDRAIQFDGTWPGIPELLAFKPWNKRELLGAAVRRLGLAGA